MPTDIGVGAVAGEQVLAAEGVAAVWRPHLHLHPLALADALHLVVEAQVDEVGELHRAVDEILLHVVLLQVDEGGHLVARLGQEVETEDFPLAVEHTPDPPGHPLRDHPLPDPETVEDLKRPLRPAYRP